MHRFALLTVVLSILLLSTNAFSQKNVPTYQADLHYKIINPGYSPNDDKHVIVYEFFSYKCPHCANFQPYMKSLRKKLPSYAKIIGIPLGLQSSWKTFAQAYYTAQSMGILEKSHIALFNALHKQHKKFRNLEDIARWYASEFGIDKDKFIATANSFMVDSMVNKGNNIAIKVEALRTPKLVINGKFMPDASALGSYDALIDLTLNLIEQEANRMGLK